MKTSTTLKILAVALQILIVLSSTVSSESNRHPDNLIELAERSEYTYNKLVQWLNITGVASSLGVNLSSFEDVVEKSPHILEKVYSNATLAMFIGGLQLRQLKISARISSDIKSNDVIGLMKAVALGLNISKVYINCGDLFSKVFINLAHPGRCSYSISDIDSLLQYVVALGRGLPREHLASVLSKVYSMRLALQVKEVREDVFNKVLTDLLYEDSLVLYIVLSDIMRSSGIRITPVQTITKPLLSTSNGTTHGVLGSVDVGSTITLADLEKALSIVTELISLAEKHGISISAEDVMMIVEYILSVDFEKAVLAVRSISIEDIKRLENVISVISRERVGIDVEDILALENLENIGFFGVPIVNIVAPSKNTNSTKAGTALPIYNLDEIYGENLEATDLAIDIDSYINSKKMMFSSVLAPTLHRINLVDIPIVYLSTNTVTNYHRTTAHNMQSRSNALVTQGVGRDDLMFYLVLFISTVIGVVAILRPRWFLLTFARITRIFRAREGFANTTQRSRGGVLEFFWVLVNRLALKLGVEIQGSDTHREIYNKIAPRVIDHKSAARLKDIVRGYEVLRYSDKPTVDENLWIKSVKDFLDEYR